MSRYGSSIDRLHRQLAARTAPQAVIRLFNGRFALIPADSCRLVSLQRSPRWSSRLCGVFLPDVSMPVLREELSA